MWFKELIFFHNQSPKVPHQARMRQVLAVVMEIIANCFITFHNNHYYTNTSPYTHLNEYSWQSHRNPHLKVMAYLLSFCILSNGRKE